MKKFIGKCAILFGIFILVIVFTNFMIDLSNLFKEDFVDAMVSELSQGKIISISSEDMDERLLQEQRIKSMNDIPDTVILGSSRVMMAKWNFDCYDAGVSGAVLEDYLGILGLLEAENKLPAHLIIGVDPWIFNANCTESRYRSIQNYVDYEIRLINEQAPGATPISGSSITYKIDKLKELGSISYFQSAVHSYIIKIITNGVTTNRKITVEDNAEYGDRPKILPNGVRIPQKSRFLTADECSMRAKRNIATNTIYFVNDFEKLSEEKTELFINLIDYLLDKGISVDFYLPAWFPAYYDVFENSDTSSGVIEAEKFIHSVAAERKITVHGSYDPTATGITEEDFMDDLHLKPEVLIEQYDYIA